MQFPYEMATSPVGGTVYVGDFLGNRIQRFGSDGSCLAKWGNQGSANGEFNSPAHVAVGLDGTVYVSD